MMVRRLFIDALRLATPRCLRLIAVALALVLASLPASALAAPCPRTSVADIEDEVMCPVCKTPLGLAQEAPQADRERAFILARVERCESKDEIKAALAAEFGDEVLALPEQRGFDLAAYLVPALAFAAALGGCALALLRWRGRRPGASALAGGQDESRSKPYGRDSNAYPGPEATGAARLERDLERYDL
jgi:cytochrome c-type biogenesis protein CcmH